jgi:hypothetical protein
MEALPKLPMISLGQKISPDNQHFTSTLSQLITSGGEDASSYEKEIKELSALRYFS